MTLIPTDAEAEFQVGLVDVTTGEVATTEQLDPKLTLNVTTPPEMVQAPDTEYVQLVGASVEQAGL